MISVSEVVCVDRELLLRLRREAWRVARELDKMMAACSGLTDALNDDQIPSLQLDDALESGQP